MTNNLEVFKQDLGNLLANTQRRIAAIDETGYALAQEERALSALERQVKANKEKRLSLMYALSEAQPTPQSEQRVALHQDEITKAIHHNRVTAGLPRVLQSAQERTGT